MKLTAEGLGESSHICEMYVTVVLTRYCLKTVPTAAAVYAGSIDFQPKEGNVLLTIPCVLTRV